MADATLYDRDFRLWALEMSRIVDEGRWDRLDRRNVAGELASIARQEQRTADALFCWLLKQLLLWWARPERRCGRWKSRVLERRFRLRDILADSPSIETASLIARNWPLGTAWVVAKQGLLRDPFPSACPFSLAQLLDPGFWPEELP
jgi:hypothetical protein